MEKIRSSPEKESEESEDKSIELNEMLSYEPIKQDEVWIHIDDVRDLSLSEKIELFREGLRDLSEILQTDSTLGKVKIISGMSWIVSKNPKLLESLGFTVAENLIGLEDQLKEYEKRKDTREIHTDDTPGYAYIDKEKFIDLYGEQVDQSVREKSA